MNYYLVKCKFGHVGRDKYLPLNVPIAAESVKMASQRAKQVAGIKKDHRDWCLESPTQITSEEYRKELIKFKSDVYFEKHSRSRLYLFKDRLVDEANYYRHDKVKTNRKVYKTSRDQSIVKYKCMKRQLTLTSFIFEQINEFESRSGFQQLA